MAPALIAMPVFIRVSRVRKHDYSRWKALVMGYYYHCRKWVPAVRLLHPFHIA